MLVAITVSRGALVPKNLIISREPNPVQVSLTSNIVNTRAFATRPLAGSAMPLPE